MSAQVSEKDAPVTVQVLAGKEAKTEVLAFLAERPVCAVFMSSLIYDNGLAHPSNRGTFYGCRNHRGKLEGVALIGHATLVEAHTEEALAAFAREAQGCSSANSIMGEQALIQRFWQYYAGRGQSSRLVTRSLLLEQRQALETFEGVPELRLARAEDLSLLVPVNAQLSFEECGVNPLERDPQGFRWRLAQRVERGRVWVWVKDGRLIFKADLHACAEEAVYLEGIYVAPEERGKHYGQRCMTQLARNFLARTTSLYLLVNEKNVRAREFYSRIGYKLRAYFGSIYLQQQPRTAAI